jgi:hypothetical protein
VSTCADFVVETAVDLVLLGTEDGGEVVCHVEDICGRDSIYLAADQRVELFREWGCSAELELEEAMDLRRVNSR